METTTVNKYLTKIPFSKKEQLSIAEQIVFAVVNGDIDPIECEIRLKSFETIINLIRKNKDYKFVAENELQKYGKSTTLMGATISQEQKRTYDYSICNDSVLNDLEAQKVQIEKMIEARQMMLKTGVNAETGEVFNAPIVKISNFFKIIFKK